MTFKMWEVKFIRTGSGETPKFGTVSFSTGDTFGNDGTIKDIADIFDAFEDLAANGWHTYENRHAIEQIRLVYASKI